jgi:four helix bundle protein
MSKHAISCPVRSYRDLIVWQKAIELVTEVYRATENLPHAERFGLSSQLRRPAVSVPRKVAEGQGRRSSGEFKQFLGHARGSLLEIETQIFIAKNLGYLSEEQCTGLHRRTEEIGRILTGCWAHLKAGSEDCPLAIDR